MQALLSEHSQKKRKGVGYNCILHINKIRLYGITGMRKTE